MEFWKCHGALVAVLSLAWLLRVATCLRGGQLFWNDETRYFRTFHFLHRVSEWDPGGALDVALAAKQHPGFLFGGILPMVAQGGTMLLLRLPVKETLWIAAAVLSLASVSCIAFVYAIARKSGGRRKEALTAAILMACSVSMFYYSRHLLPYDLSLALLLLAVWIGLDPRPGAVRSLGCGVLAGAALLVYYGCWPAFVIVLLIHALYGQRTPATVITRGLLVGLGAATFPLLFTGAGLARIGPSHFARLVKYSRSIRHGDPGEGWRIVWEYLWHTEHALAVVWVLGIAVLAWLAVKRPSSASSRGLFWLCAAAGVYGLIVLASNGTGRFVVYGRTTRDIVPFLCLTTACAITCLAEARRSRRPPHLLLASCLLGLVAPNFWKPLTTRFPIDVEERVVATYGDVARDLSVLGPKRLSSARPSLQRLPDDFEAQKSFADDAVPKGPVEEAEAGKGSRYVLLNAQLLYPITGTRPEPEGLVVFRTAHPLEFLPYQYEGWDPREREILRSSDISIRVIDTRSPPRMRGESD